LPNISNSKRTAEILFSTFSSNYNSTKISNFVDKTGYYYKKPSQKLEFEFGS